jgi:hypothetical protein
MLNQNCLTAFQNGQAERLEYPLPYGRYKLEESMGRLVQYRDELGRIRDYVSGKGDRWALMHCTSYDKYVWLRAVPSSISHRLGKDLLPGLLALEADGAPRCVIQCIYPRIEKSCWSLIHNSEEVRLVINKSINAEYSEMRTGGSVLEPLVDDAISLFDEALAALH